MTTATEIMPEAPPGVWRETLGVVPFPADNAVAMFRSMASTDTGGCMRPVPLPVANAEPRVMRFGERTRHAGVDEASMQSLYALEQLAVARDWAKRRELELGRAALADVEPLDALFNRSTVVTQRGRVAASRHCNDSWVPHTRLDTHAVPGTSTYVMVIGTSSVTVLLQPTALHAAWQAARTRSAAANAAANEAAAATYASLLSAPASREILEYGGTHKKQQDRRAAAPVEPPVLGFAAARTQLVLQPGQYAVFSSEHMRHYACGLSDNLRSSARTGTSAVIVLQTVPTLSPDELAASRKAVRAAAATVATVEASHATLPSLVHMEADEAHAEARRKRPREADDAGGCDDADDADDDRHRHYGRPRKLDPPKTRTPNHMT